jgi:hypothetical protein
MYLKSLLDKLQQLVMERYSEWAMNYTFEDTNSCHFDLDTHAVLRTISRAKNGRNLLNKQLPFLATVPTNTIAIDRLSYQSTTALNLHASNKQLCVLRLSGTQCPLRGKYSLPPGGLIGSYHQEYLPQNTEYQVLLFIHSIYVEAIYVWSQCSVCLRAGRPRSRSSSPSRVKNFLVSTLSRRALRANPALSPAGKVVGAWSLLLNSNSCQCQENMDSPTRLQGQLYLIRIYVCS